jgi:hypothetical protein
MSLLQLDIQYNPAGVDSGPALTQNRVSLKSVHHRSEVSGLVSSPFVKTLEPRTLQYGLLDYGFLVHQQEDWSFASSLLQSASAHCQRFSWPPAGEVCLWVELLGEPILTSKPLASLRVGRGHPGSSRRTL